MRIVELDEIGDAPVGGKATGLARLRSLGLAVPEAVVLVADAGRDGAEGGAEGSRAGRDGVIERLCDRFGEAALAVRSSAIGEDGDAASFAGQYETRLDVRGREALDAAVEACLASIRSGRARAYRAARDAGDARGSSAPPMSLVVQRMVDARAAGVCFTVCPVTNRRNRVVIDSVAGLGEALVSGEASPDHDEFLREERRFEPTALAGERAVLEPAWREQIVADALEAERRLGQPLDLEWAIDRDGRLHWLQARPITTLGPDPQALDTPLDHPRDVFTRCNVGEMMPGAVSPLTYSTCARGIDEGWQRIRDAVGLPRLPGESGRYVAMSHGHLFIDLSEGARVSSRITGASADQQSLAICGRRVPEVVTPPPPPWWVRAPRILRQLAAVLRPGPRLRRLAAIADAGDIPSGPDAAATWRAIDARLDTLFEAYRLHLEVSAGAGALASILLQRLAGDDEPSDTDHAIVATLLSGAEGVESADIAEGAEAILEALLAQPDAARCFVEQTVDEAVAWLGAAASGAAGLAWRDYLRRHGHRSLRELDVRQPEWAHDPTPLLRSLQAQVRGRLEAGASGANEANGVGEGGALATRSGRAADDAVAAGVARFARLRSLAHAAVRNRERAKSRLVAETVHFKRAYRRLAEQLVAEGRLPDADAVYFLLHEELGALAASAPGDRLAEVAVGRRQALTWQETLHFPEVCVGRPQPVPVSAGDPEDGVVVGKPVSGGRVEGPVRVVRSLEEAEGLRPGEILVAPITDVGWTPYFAVIAGLVTDVGSAVSHGAVVAREYGLPAVLNTGHATSVLRTGERVLLDGDRGTVERLDAAPASGSATPHD